MELSVRLMLSQHQINSVADLSFATLGAGPIRLGPTVVILVYSLFQVFSPAVFIFGNENLQLFLLALIRQVFVFTSEPSPVCFLSTPQFCQGVSISGMVA